MSRAIAVVAGLLLLVAAGLVGSILTPSERVVELPAVRVQPCEPAIADPPRHCIEHDGRWVCAER